MDRRELAEEVAGLRQENGRLRLALAEIRAQARVELRFSAVRELPRVASTLEAIVASVDQVLPAHDATVRPAPVARQVRK